MPDHYIKRLDLSKYTLKSFVGNNEYTCDKNNGDILTINKNGTVVTVQDSNSPSASSSPIEIIGATAGGAASSAYTLVKTVTAVPDNTATAVFTVTIPNPTVSANATILVQVLGVIGAGGAVGAGESSSGSTYIISLARTVGVTTVVATSSQGTVASGKVAGAHTFTCTVAASSVSGAAGVTQTFTINATAIDVTTGATNHVVTMTATVLNGATGGVSIA